MGLKDKETTIIKYRRRKSFKNKTSFKSKPASGLLSLLKQTYSKWPDLLTGNSIPEQRLNSGAREREQPEWPFSRIKPLVGSVSAVYEKELFKNRNRELEGRGGGSCACVVVPGEC
ncbi:SWI/SNF-related matrix-associated actin-dependent regulator of chromatin subfamily E member 1 [Platysternon megacephalum]|uniref:SWI/SNF-related matrix-associated actin-dependent regulator of chromatin subfamily E member 1 n=1 Tax=Platysternon megacephalum TaxID=55544 RepID=A0A4D9DZX7_9SAUR|nr:SWI/SNF-related matrix-associated actin-dependent regulator of chromatin subfamily E member 1 [Platysternon megacephalum]